MPVQLVVGPKISVSFATVVATVKMLDDVNQKSAFLAQAATDSLTVNVPDSSSDALKNAIAAAHLSNPISLNDLATFVDGLVAGGQATALINDNNAYFEVPADTANALKRFVDNEQIVHPLADSITGQAADCPPGDYRCPHAMFTN